MGSVRVNVAANFSGKLGTGIVALAVAPVYTRWLGIEAYGLVGMFAAIQGILSILDLGLGATLNQQLARLSAKTETIAQLEMRDLVRTFEVVYALIGLTAGFVVVMSAPWLARHLLHANAVPQEAVNEAVRLMGIAFALQWPVSLYSGALAGTQRQVLWNALSVSGSIVRNLGALIALQLAGKTIEVFFIWQIAAALLNALACRFAVWQVLPSSSSVARFRSRLLSNNLRFVADLTGSSFLAVGITQIDKFLLGAVLPLSELGYYTLATTISNALYSVIGPLFTATFPRLTQLVAESRIEDVGALYHKACQAMSFVILPPALVAALFAPELMLAWTGAPETALHTQRLVPFLVLGTTLNGLVNMPYALQLAYGWSRFGLMQNVVSAIVIIPLILGLVHWLGAFGGTVGWFALNAGYVVIGLPVMHRRLLTGDYSRWLLGDVLPPLIAAVAVVGSARAFLPFPFESRTASLTVLCAVGLVAMTAAISATPVGRDHLRGLRRWVGRKLPQVVP